MYTRRLHGLRQVALLLITGLSAAAWAESPALLLEKGLYAEQTEGDLDKAMGLYQQIIDEAEEQKNLVGSAHLRIGLCLLKAGETDAGAKRLQTVLDAFPEDAALVAQANAAAKTYDINLKPADSPVAQWQEKLEACTNHKQAAFSVVPMMLDSLEPDDAWLAVKAAWPNLKNDDVKTGISKAFAFQNHPQVLEVLDLGMRDRSMPVKSYVKSYVGWYAFRDFAEDYSAYDTWRTENIDKTLADVAIASLKVLLSELSALSTEEQISRLALMEQGLRQHTTPEMQRTLRAELLGRALEIISNTEEPRDPSARIQAQELRGTYIGILRSMNLSREQLEPLILPLVNPDMDSSVLTVIQGPEQVWALDRLIELLEEATQAKNRSLLWAVAQSLGRIGSPRSIPPMIAAINADNTYDTVYGVGYFGLGQLTGVRYEESHDGAWWLDWWKKNKDQFDLGEDEARIPDMTKVVQKVTSEAQGSATDWHLGAADHTAYAKAKDDANAFRGEIPTTLKSTKPEPPGFATLLQETSAAPFRGQRCWLNAQVKALDVAQWSGVWMRVDDAQDNTLAFDNMQDRPIKGTSDWAEYHVVLDVPETAEKITYGLLLRGAGQVWLADVKMQPAPGDLPVTSRPVEKPAPGIFFLAGMDPDSYEMGEETSAPHPGLETRFLKSTATPRGFGTMMADIPPNGFRGKRVQLSAKVKANVVANWAGLWMRVDGANHSPLAFDNMQERAIKGPHDWKELSVVLDVPEEAENIAYGLLLDGEGQVWVADLKLEEAAPDAPLTGMPIGKNR